jgi:Na+-transporting NADH:ubiquinone oxidoreductase subunit F
MAFIRLLHKWVGLIAGLQVCLWLVSGLVMSLLDHHVVSGDSTADEQTPAVLAPGETLLDPQQLLTTYAADPVQRIELQRRLGGWVWRVQSVSGVRLHDAASGKVITIDAGRARAIADAGRAGDAVSGSATLLETPTLEARDHAPPLWRVDFKDAQQTRYYIAADDGRILERRTGDWRVFDVFWMLHTMDYRGRDDFNHPLVITFAFLSVWLALSGVLLLFRSFGIGGPQKTAKKER